MRSSQSNNLINLRQTGRITRLLCIAAVFVAVIMGSPAARTNAADQARPSAYGSALVNFSPSTRVMLFSTGTRQWKLATFSEAKAGDEFYFNGIIYQVVDSKSAHSVLSAGADRIFEADQAYDKSNSRKPSSIDIVQVLDKDMRPKAHSQLDKVQPGSYIRFLGKAYSVASDLSLKDTGLVYSPSAYSLQHIEIAQSAWLHITDRHTHAGRMTDGKSIFNQGENIPQLIKNAEILVPVLESNGYCSREFDAGRSIGSEGKNGRQTSTYRVITTQSGKLVTAYPIAQ